MSNLSKSAPAEDARDPTSIVRAARINGDLVIYGLIDLGAFRLACVIRSGARYCSAGQLVNTVYDKFDRIFSGAIYAAVSVEGFLASDAEREIFWRIRPERLISEKKASSKEIRRYGHLVRADDAERMLEYLRYCYRRLLVQQVDDRCGFVHFQQHPRDPDDVLLIPYVVIESEKLCPVSFLDGVPVGRMLKVVVKDWDLAYLNFCCLVMGVAADGLAKLACVCVRWRDVEMRLPESESAFCWPYPGKHSRMLVMSGTNADGGKRDFSSCLRLPAAEKQSGSRDLRAIGRCPRPSVEEIRRIEVPAERLGVEDVLTRRPAEGDGPAVLDDTSGTFFNSFGTDDDWTYEKEVNRILAKNRQGRIGLDSSFDDFKVPDFGVNWRCPDDDTRTSGDGSLKRNRDGADGRCCCKRPRFRILNSTL